MIGPALTAGRQSWAVRYWLASLVLLLIAAGCFTVAGIGGQRDTLMGPLVPGFVSAPTAGSTAGPSATTPVGPSPGLSVPGLAPPIAAAGGSTGSPHGAVAVAGRSAPVLLRIPAIGLAVAVAGLGLNPDQTVQVPTDFQQAGWFRLGPAPGQLGSAVILGHVDSYRGPAVFYRLRSLRPGDAVEVSSADGAVARFVVNTVVMYAKTQFPAQQVYGSHGYPALQLVTCGGEFDTHTRSYLSNVVVSTSLVTTTPATHPAG